MKRYGIIAILSVPVFFGLGCQKGGVLQEGLSPGESTSRSLGEASFPQACVAASEVLGQYFSIDPDVTDANAGIFRSRPRDVLDAGRDRLLGDSPARQIATLQIIQEGPVVTARVQVLQQREGSSSRRQMAYAQQQDNYNLNPGNLSSGEVDAATTASQNEMWINEKRRRDLEGQILDELFQKLQGK